jgi:hypothetical protein
VLSANRPHSRRSGYCCKDDVVCGRVSFACLL